MFLNRIKNTSIIKNMSRMYSSQSNKQIGIIGADVYIPRNYVAQSSLEKYDGVSSGKYSKGLGQYNMAFAESYEDIVSMMLTSTSNLLEKTGINVNDVGRLEVGTETLIDKSKATKTSLMQLFGDNTDIEGVDTINACYGGTNALFNALHWMNSPAWDGRYAIVTTGDIAVYEKGPARPTGGAGIVSMLLGPQAPIEIDISLPRSTHMEDAYDFYKPHLMSEYPVVDGHHSNSCYFRSLDKCFEVLGNKTLLNTGKKFDMRNYDHILFHQPYQKLVKKSYGRMLYNQHIISNDVDDRYNNFLEMSKEESYVNRDLSNLNDEISSFNYNDVVYPSTWIGREAGNLYTGSLYAGLMSLVSKHGNNLAGKDALLFSYGSGLAATLFHLSFNNKSNISLDNLSKMLDLDNLLDTRVELNPEEFTDCLSRRENEYGIFPWSVDKINTKNIREGTYYLENIDNLGRRTYNKF